MSPRRVPVPDAPALDSVLSAGASDVGAWHCSVSFRMGESYYVARWLICMQPRIPR